MSQKFSRDELVGYFVNDYVRLDNHSVLEQLG